MSEISPTFLLVDGHNVIHAVPDLLKLYRKRPAAAQRELIKRMKYHQDASDERVVLVFDGRGDKINEERHPGGLQIIYASADSSADLVIERLAVAYAEKYSIIVATNDVSIQDAAVAAGGEAISVSMLEGKMEASKRSLNRWIKKRS